MEKETVGERVYRVRKEKELSQQAISGKGLTTAHISRIEHGLRNPSVRAIRQLAEQLDVDAHWLETGRVSHVVCVSLPSPSNDPTKHDSVTVQIPPDVQGEFEIRVTEIGELK